MNTVRIDRPIKLFMLEDLRRARYVLRRYVGNSVCPLPQGYHDARSEPVAETDELPGSPYTGTNPPQIPATHSSWPSRCACGYAFTADAESQVFALGLYRRPDTGEVMTWEDAPAGAVREASWWPDKGADGHAWMVKLPDGSFWMTENKATNCNCPPDPAHRCWSRSGQVPLITVSPSIATPRWHGWLREGMLIQA